MLAGFNDGGYYARWWLWAALGLAALTAINVLLGRRGAFSPLAWVSVGALGALLLWMLLSAAWGVPGTEALREAGRGFVYLAALVAFLVVVRDAAVQAFLGGILTGIVTLVAYGLFDRLTSSRAPDPFQGSLLVEPVGYANALGILAAIGLLLAVAMLDSEQRLKVSVLLLCAACVSAVGLVLTSSRGAWLATAVGMALLGVLRIRRTRHISQRRWLVLAATVALALGVWTVALAPMPAMGDRPSYWGVALDDARRHPLLGSGAGSFDDVWIAHRPIAANVRDAHSLYLEVLAELGPIGLALVLTMLAAPLAAAVLARGSPVTAIAAAGYSAYLVHTGLDWDWEYPVVTLAGLACGAGLLIAARAHASDSHAVERILSGPGHARPGAIRTPTRRGS